MGDGDGDTPPTRSYVDALLRGNLSEDQVASLRAGITDREDDPATKIARSYPPRVPSSPPTSGKLGGSHPPSAPPPASWPSPSSYAPHGYDGDLDDEQRTVARVFRPAHFQAPPPLPDEPEEEAPFSFEPSADIAEPYVFDDDPRGDEPEGEEPGNLTAVHIYSSQEIGEMIDLGDLGDLGQGTGMATGAPPSSPDYDALLIESYLAALGGPSGVPYLATSEADVCSLPLGPQAAFVLSRIDGQSSVEDVLDMAGLGRAETLRILYDLLQQGAIVVDA